MKTFAETEISFPQHPPFPSFHSSSVPSILSDPGTLFALLPFSVVAQCDVKLDDTSVLRRCAPPARLVVCQTMQEIWRIRDVSVVKRVSEYFRYLLQWPENTHMHSEKDNLPQWLTDYRHNRHAE